MQRLLLDGTDSATYETITSSLGRQLALLSSSWRDAPESYPRLLALIALVLADMSLAGHERQLKGAEAALDAELGRQILPDGGHISRNPNILVEIMLDLLPLSQCFVARSRQHPPQLLEAMARILPMLRFLRMGDGMLARFNGMSIPDGGRARHGARLWRRLGAGAARGARLGLCAAGARQAASSSSTSGRRRRCRQRERRKPAACRSR